MFRVHRLEEVLLVNKFVFDAEKLKADFSSSRPMQTFSVHTGSS